MKTITTRTARRIHMAMLSAGALTLIAGTSMAEPGRGEVLTKAVCMACHGEGQAGQQRLAPPMAMVRRHYTALSKDQRERAIAKWLQQPDAEKSRMPGAIRNFGLMPKLVLHENDIKAVAEYVAGTLFETKGDGATASGTAEPRGWRGGRGAGSTGSGRGHGRGWRGGRGGGESSD